MRNFVSTEVFDSHLFFLSVYEICLIFLCQFVTSTPEAVDEGMLECRNQCRKSQGGD
jgi:hypothetical protein